MKEEYEDLTGRRFGRWTVVMDGKRKCLSINSKNTPPS